MELGVIELPLGDDEDQTVDRRDMLEVGRLIIRHVPKVQKTWRDPRSGRHITTDNREGMQMWCQAAFQNYTRFLTKHPNITDGDPATTSRCS